MLKAGALQLPFAPPWSEKANSDIQTSSKGKTASTADKVCNHSVTICKSLVLLKCL